MVLSMSLSSLTSSLRGRSNFLFVHVREDVCAAAVLCDVYCCHVDLKKNIAKGLLKLQMRIQ